MRMKVGLLCFMLFIGAASASLFAQTFYGYSVGLGAKLFSSTFNDQASSSSTTVTSVGFNSVVFRGSNLGFYSDVAFGIPVSATSSATGSISLSQYDRFKLALDEVGPIGYAFKVSPNLLVLVGGPVHAGAVVLGSSSFTAPETGWVSFGAGLSGQAIYQLSSNFGLYADASFGYDFFGFASNVSSTYGGGYGWGVGAGVDILSL